jgi:hypothetical protein
MSSSAADPDVIVIERTDPRFDEIILSTRRFFIKAGAGNGFARWVTSGKSGRFLILQPKGSESLEEYLCNCDTEDALVAELRRRHDALCPGGGSPCNFHISVYMTAEVQERLTRELR